MEGKDPKINMKCIECIRRDFCDLVIKTQKRMVQLILENKIDEAVKHVQSVMERLHKGEVDIADLVLSKKLSQPPDQY